MVTPSPSAPGAPVRNCPLPMAAPPPLIPGDPPIFPSTSRPGTEKTASLDFIFSPK